MEADAVIDAGSGDPVRRPVSGTHLKTDRTLDSRVIHAGSPQGFDCASDHRLVWTVGCVKEHSAQAVRLLHRGSSESRRRVRFRKGP